MIMTVLREAGWIGQLRKWTGGSGRGSESMKLRAGRRVGRLDVFDAFLGDVWDLKFEARESGARERARGTV
jgi:hypothetical protein